MDMWQQAAEYIGNNQILLGIIALLVVIVFFVWKNAGKAKRIHVDRGQVERMKFIDRMEQNESRDYDWLYHGRKLKGKILKYSELTLHAETPQKPMAAVAQHEDELDYDEEPADIEAIIPKKMPKVHETAAPKQLPPKIEEIHVIRMVIMPILFNRKILNPLGKRECFQVAEGAISDRDAAERAITISPKTSFDTFGGVWYDGTDERMHTRFIKYDNMIRTDYNEMAGIYLVKSQEQSSFDPNAAHDMIMKEKEIQAEALRKKGQQSSI